MKIILTIGTVAVLGLFGLFMATSNPTLPVPAASNATISSANLWNRTELYFGSGKPDIAILNTLFLKL